MRGLTSTDLRFFFGGSSSPPPRGRLRDASSGRLVTDESRVWEESGEGYEVGGEGDRDRQLSSDDKSLRSLLELSIVASNGESNHTSV